MIEWLTANRGDLVVGAALLAAVAAIVAGMIRRRRSGGGCCGRCRGCGSSSGGECGERESGRRGTLPPGERSRRFFPPVSRI